ncbi:MAG: indolepyruvate oxidoreductase, partial [Aquabacterium sp.]
MIERWLGGVVQGLQRHWPLGHEVALCGRLIKGYGATNERGKANLLHIVEHLAAATGPAAGRADAVTRALAAAQADEAGTALDQLLRDQGAPPRPLREQVVRFYKRRPA